MKTDEMEKIRIAKGYSYAQIAELTGMKEEQVKETLRGQADYLHLEDAFALEVALTASHTPTREEVAQIVYDLLKLPDDWGAGTGPEQEGCEEGFRGECSVLRVDRSNLSASGKGKIKAKDKAWMEADCICEEMTSQVYQIPGIVRKRQGEYTLEDYYNLPEETLSCVEMIDGVFFYTKTAPSPWHAIALQEVIWLIHGYIRKKQGSCFVFIEPVDVYIKEKSGEPLADDSNTVVKPDGFVVCNRDTITNDGIIGPPDFVVEVLSKSTRLVDLKVKTRLYGEAGVREYWIVDLEHETVIVYRFGEKAGPTIYGFNDTVPVGIYDGDLLIDFQEIRDALARAGYYRQKEKEQ